jgi:formyl-CoA transferase
MPSEMVARPPEFGEQTQEVLTKFGFAAGEITELRKAKIVSPQPAAIYG